MKKNKVYFIVSWVAVLAVAVAIFLFSAQDAQESTEVSHGLIERIVLWYTRCFGIPCSTGQLVQISAFWDHFVRKLAHFSIYTLLGFCCCNACYHTFFRLKKSFGISFIAGVFYAISDEIHQLFVPGRSCQFSDMVLDSCGVLVGVLLFFTLFLIITKRRSVRI
ncbi:MAG: VanZ family protein [Ruminococcaceae bacterium]|nr:VanZ family protein [Oscillospiraceae bacterium]